MEESFNNLASIQNKDISLVVAEIEKQYIKVLVNYYTCCKLCLFKKSQDTNTEQCISICQTRGDQINTLIKSNLDNISKEYKHCTALCTQSKSQNCYSACSTKTLYYLKDLNTLFKHINNKSYDPLSKSNL